MPKVLSQTEQEKRWRAEDDARALKRAQEIQNDPSRVKEAHKVIKEEYVAISSVAKKLGVTSELNKTAKKTTAKKKK
jgi:hypothetical protein